MNYIKGKKNLKITWNCVPLLSKIAYVIVVINSIIIIKKMTKKYERGEKMMERELGGVGDEDDDKKHKINVN